MAGTLYIVATPIGNLEDMPPRVAATFGAADFIAAEDTRVTMKLLNFLGLKKPMVSYYEHALPERRGHPAAALRRGRTAPSARTPECPASPTRARSSCGTRWPGASK